ncbi:MAG: prolipoprotein diacylglyceryl transferase, partial [Clostridia bacterium]|nr:prolipoprotein diacylglyceryl transferase [Clostridia bacterium]
MTISAIDRVAFSIGSLTVEWYGIIATTAIILGLLYGLHEGSRIGLTKDDVLELFLWVIPLAVIFSRLVYIIPRADQYFPWDSWDAFVNAWAIWEGGITIIGGIIGGVLGGIIFWLRKKKTVSFGKLVDLVMPILLLCQAIGRWGNFINQEAFGIAITNPNLQWFPFAVYIDRAVGFVDGWYAATFFYESVLNFIAAAVFFIIWRKNKKYPGILGFIYCAWYFLIRALLEFIRLDAVPVTQVLCFIVFPLALASGIVYMVLRNRKLKQAESLASGVMPEIKNAEMSNESKIIPQAVNSDANKKAVVKDETLQKDKVAIVKKVADSKDNTEKIKDVKTNANTEVKEKAQTKKTTTEANVTAKTKKTTTEANEIAKTNKANTE